MAGEPADENAASITATAAQRRVDCVTTRKQDSFIGIPQRDR